MKNGGPPSEIQKPETKDNAVQCGVEVVGSRYAYCTIFIIKYQRVIKYQRGSLSELVQ